MDLCVSGKYGQEVFVLFVNKTTRFVDIFWINYKGNHQSFGSIGPGEQKKVNTFSKHPWVFRDKCTGEKLHTDNKDIFWPIPTFYNGTPTRKVVCIHFPLRSLFVNAMWTLVTTDSIDVDNAEALDVPVIIKSQIINFHEKYKSYCQS